MPVCVLSCLQEIQSLLINWKGPDLTTYGELVLEGTFHVLRAKNTRSLFLFERMLLITKKRGEHYVYKTHISVGFFLNRISFHYGGKNILVVIIIIINSEKASASFPLCLWSQCSTLMLLDSAKDPLLFSVIHFKHPKQPHTVQVSVNTSRLTLLSVHMDLCSASFFAWFNFI